MIMEQATAMEALMKEGNEIRVEIMDGEPQEMLSLEGLLRLCDLTGTPKAARFKTYILERFGA